MNKRIKTIVTNPNNVRESTKSLTHTLSKLPKKLVRVKVRYECEIQKNNNIIVVILYLAKAKYNKKSIYCTQCKLIIYLNIQS